MRAKEVAAAFTNLFLENGNFESSGGPMSPQALPAAAVRAGIPEQFDQGFDGLSVHAVGYETGEVMDGETELEDIAEDDEVHIYVTRGSKRALSALPASVGGIRVRVHNDGRIIVKPHLSATTVNRGNVYNRDGRIACGSSCAPSGIGLAGTFGALVKKPDGMIYVLSNNHVIGDCNHAPIGLPIMAPADIDGRVQVPRGIAKHSEIVELRSGAPAQVSPCREDLAIAEVLDENEVSSWQGDDHGYDTPALHTPPSRRLRVKKFGRTTGLTHGVIEAMVVNRTSIPYNSQYFSATVWFNGSATVRSLDSSPFALGGDSGSLVVTEDGQKAVGILFATASKGSIAHIIPMERVLHAFGGISLVGSHGI